MFMILLRQTDKQTDDQDSMILLYGRYIFLQMLFDCSMWPKHAMKKRVKKREQSHRRSDCDIQEVSYIFHVVFPLPEHGGIFDKNV